MQIFPQAPHPVPPAKQHTGNATTSSSEEQLRVACTFSSAVLMRSFKHRLNQLFKFLSKSRSMILGNLTYRYKCSRTREGEAERERVAFALVHPAAEGPAQKPRTACSRALAERVGAEGELSPAVGKALRREGGGMESFPREQLHAGDGWRMRREARTFLSSSYTLVHSQWGKGNGNQRGTDGVVRGGGGGGEGEGSPDSPEQPPPPQPAWSAAKPHKNATRSHDLRRTCNSLPSPGRPCAILY